ncbi:hybrid sensor histidine kinase/response regulator [Reinekea blandensis]|uniref:histidine kinase n=1 Tax=Reinekea blandensis MED297 TaxID=314283 RepID=A4BGF2_9GAMM|nr:hybrid sensor histidine kinase/response regulator [Reinekea blandensis]EAR08758.1 sensor protein LuxQ [Reinekea sp. MED297] [Reinekea blandensis MED297]
MDSKTGQNRQFLLLGLALFCLLLSPAWSQELLLEDRPVPINGAWQVLNPDIEITSIEQALQRTDSDWQPIDNPAGSVGMTEGAHWLKLSLNNRSDIQRWYIVFNNRGINHVSGWWLTPEGIIDTFTIGAARPYEDSRHLPLPQLNTPLPDTNGQSLVLLVKIEHVGYLDVNGRLYPAEQAMIEFRQDGMIEWLFYGIYIAFLTLHLGLFLSSRDLSHLGYVAFVGSAFLFFLYAEGYTYSLFRYSSSLAYLIGQSSIALISISSAFFTLTYLSLNRSRARWLMYAIMILGASFIAGRMVSKAFPILPLGSLLAILTFVVIPLISLHQHRHQQSPYALSFFLAWSLWSLLTAIVTLATFGVIRADVSMLWIYLKIAFAAHNLVLTWSVGLRMRELFNSRKQARAESEAKSNLIAQVSHEIRTPMNGIIGTSQLLEAHLHGKEAHHLNDVIFHSGTTLLTIINDLLDLSRLETGRIRLRPEPVDLRKLMGQVFQILNSQIKQKKLQYELTVSDHVPDWVELDPVRLRQVLLNIVGNAIKYTDQGQVRMTADYRHPSLSIQIDDTGRGIPETHLKSLFQPYVQVRQDAEEERKGTGLGLHIAQSLVDLMEGHLSLESTEGQGTTVQLLVPTRIVDPPFTDKEPSQAAEVRTLRILIADDNPVNRTVLTGLLKRLGHQVTETCDGTQVVSEYFEHFEQYDVILMDCEMPQMDGFTATRKIREIEVAKHVSPIPILAVTAHSLETYGDEILASGMDGHLSKPVTLDALATALQAL